jgi:hypothetical protein
MTKKLPPEVPVLKGQITLDEYLNELDGPMPDQGTDITADDTIASRLLRELGSLEKQIAANTSTADYERAKITQWETVVNTPLQERALWLRGQLEQYALHERREHDRKTINLPFGVLSTRPKEARWEISDEFIEWARSTGSMEFLRTKYEPERGVIKEYFTPNSEGEATDSMGVTIPGIHVVKDADYSVTVKPTT